MPMATDMSQITIPNPPLRASQSPSLDQAEEDLDISLDNLNQMILELDPTFEPLPITTRGHSPTAHRQHTASYREDSPVHDDDEDEDEDEEVESFVLVSRGCSPGYPHAIARISPSTPTTPTAISTSRATARAVAIPQHPECASPHGSLVFSDQTSCSSSRPPLPCGGVAVGVGGGGVGVGGGVRLRRGPRPSSQQQYQQEVSGSPGTLSLGGRSSLRGSATSLLSTSPGSDTSYILGSCQSLLSDDTDSSPEGLTPSLSGSLGDVSRHHQHPHPQHRQPYGGGSSRQIQGVPLSPYLNSSPSGSLNDIPVVLINGAPQASVAVSSLSPSQSPSPSPQSSPQELIRSRGRHSSQSMRSRSPSPSPTSLHRRPSFGSQPNMKFVMDTSQYWFRPQITREEADALLKDQEAGSFVVRDSTSYRGCFGLAMKVHPAAFINPASISKPDDSAEPIRHFLIESSAKGVRVKGSSQEPYFGSLSALVYQHTISPYALPCKLVIHSQDGRKSNESSPTTSPTEDPQKTACNFLYLCAVPTEMLTGPCAIQKAVSVAFEKEAGPNPIITPTVVNLKVSPKGVTLTDVQRKLFFRRHFPVHLLSYGGEDPEGRRWQKSCKSARMFGIIAKGVEAGMENMCHVFAEYDPLQQCSYSLQLIQNIITSAASQL